MTLLALCVVLVGCRSPATRVTGGGTPQAGCLDDPTLTPPAPAILAALASATPSPASVPGPRPTPVAPAYFLHLPPQPSPDQPVPVLVTVHGFGGTGPQFATPFLPIADTNGWIVVAPTFDYGSLGDPVITREVDLRVAQQLRAILDDVPSRGGLQTQSRALLLGFSRGASMVERFALMYPDEVQAVAALSGGAYTVPQGCLVVSGAAEELPIPLGTGDLQRWLGHPVETPALQRIPFWLSVGALDTDASNLSSSYDDMLGHNRVQRGQALNRALGAFGLQTQFTIFPNVAHAVSPGMIGCSTAFLASVSSGGSLPADSAGGGGPGRRVRGEQ